MKINPKVIDIYHLDANDARGGDGADFAKAHALGIRGVIHKATQGVGITDRLYAPRRKAAVDAGMLWGAYHFNTGEGVAAQVKHFLAAAEPDAGTLMALDFEETWAGASGVLKAHPLPLTLKLATDVEAARLVAMAIKKVCMDPNCSQVWNDILNQVTALAIVPLPVQLASVCSRIP
jgi:hypothetical protein